MEFRPDLSDLSAVDSRNWITQKRVRVGERVTTPDGTQSHILMRDSWNTQMVREFVPEPGESVASKHPFSEFSGTLYIQRACNGPACISPVERL